MSMDYEKAYKDALERARGHHGVAIHYGKTEEIQELEYIFPELAESEDERIRKALITLVKDISEDDDYCGTSHCEEYIAWLEKHKEQKPIFRVGDAMRTINEAAKGIKDGLPYVVSIDSEYYNCNNEKIRIEDQGDYEFPPMNRKQPTEWGEGEVKVLNSIIDDYEKTAKSFCGYDGKIGLLRAIRDGEYNLPKAEWSEEDEEMLRNVYESLYAYQCDIRAGIMDENSRELLDDVEKEKQWLKSLRPQPHWKPTAMQMVALLRAVDDLQGKPYWGDINEVVYDIRDKLM